jgi:hypothetical protein
VVQQQEQVDFGAVGVVVVMEVPPSGVEGEAAQSAAEACSNFEKP